MTERYKRYSRDKFKQWKQRVSGYLPELAMAIYCAKKEGKRIDTEKERLLGQVIEAINNPYYTILDIDGTRLSHESILAMEVILEIKVSELFRYVKSFNH